MIFHTGVQEYQAQYYANNQTGQKEKQNLLTEHSNQIFLAEDIWEYYMSSHAALTYHTLVDNSKLIIVKVKSRFHFQIVCTCVSTYSFIYCCNCVNGLANMVFEFSHWKVNKVRLSNIWLMTKKNLLKTNNSTHPFYHHPNPTYCTFFIQVTVKRRFKA